MNQEWTIKSGSIGIAVNKIQGYLNVFQNKGYIKNRVFQDGVFGMGTKISIQQFQRYSNIDVDGVVGEQTWDAILHVLAGTHVIPHIPIAAASYRLHVQQCGLAVYKIQSYLHQMNGITTHIEVDGVYGIQTKKCVMEYQIKRGRRSSGDVGFETWDLIVNDFLRTHPL